MHLPYRGARPGSLRPVAGREADGRGRRPDRAEVWSTRTGRLVRSGHRRVGSVLWECGRRQAERHQGARSSEGAVAKWTMPRRSHSPSSGDLPQSRALAEDLAREFPEDTSVQFMYLPTLRALFSLRRPLLMRQRRFKRCRPPRATISRLGVSASSDVSAACIPSTFADWRTSRRSQPAEAAAEFQRILDHRSIVLVDPMDAHGAPAAGDERSRSRAIP